MKKRFFLAAMTLLVSMGASAQGNGIQCQQGDWAQPGVQGTQEPVPVHLCGRIARVVRNLRRHVHGRYRPVGLHRFRGRFRIGAGLGHFQDEFEIR